LELKFIILILALTLLGCNSIKKTADGKPIGKTWINIPNTGIQFSHYDQCENEICWNGNLEYFRKGDSLISVRKDLADNFYNLFSKGPKAFSDIYKIAYVVEKSELTFKNYNTTHNLGDLTSLDSIVQAIPFKTSVIIYDIQYVKGRNEFIWILSTSNKLMYSDGHDISILFNKRLKYRTTNKNPTVFKYKN
jgi:hypothetical protein